MTISKAELEAIKQRCEKATPEPWTIEHTLNVVDSDRNPVQGASGTNSEYWHQRHVANAEFIAHARTDVPALVAEVETLRTSLIIARESIEFFFVANFDASDRLQRHGKRIVGRICKALEEE